MRHFQTGPGTLGRSREVGDPVLPRDLGKALMSTPLLAELRAYLGYARSEDAQMPDPLGYRDLQWLAALPPSYGELVLPDLEHAYFANPVGSRWGMRKKDRSLRWMTTVNPAAEIWLRLRLHPYSEAIHAAQTKYAIANSYDLKHDEGANTSVLQRRSFPRTHAQLRKRLAQLRQGGHQHGFKTDVASFYPSVRPEIAGAAVSGHTSTEAGVEVYLMLERFRSETGLDGLPIGAEFSSLLSNLALEHADHVMDAIPHIEMVRWTDDIVVLDAIPQIVDGAYFSLSDALASSGLELAASKTFSTTDPGSDWTVSDLIDGFAGSQGDLQSLKRTGQPDPDVVRFADENLGSEIDASRRDTSRMNRLFGYLAWAPPDMQPLRARHASVLIHAPDIWETNVSRAVQYISNVATEEQWFDLIDLAQSLVADQPASDEQVSQICRIVAMRASQFDAPAVAAELMLAIHRRAESAIVRGWSLRAAALLAPERIRRLLFDAHGFDHLSPLEQRWAIGLAVLPDHQAFLEEQARSGKWRLTARWRLATCG